MILEPKLRILSLGAGVQSTACLLMSCQGVLPKLDAAVFADTGWEPRLVYRHLEWLEKEAAQHGIPVYRVSAGNIREDALRYQVAFDGPDSKRQIERGVTEDGRTRWGSMPYFTLDPNGEKGMIRRQCTREYKLDPIRKKVRLLAGYAPRKRIPAGFVQQWIGISADEWKRQRGSGEAWRINRHPLVEREICREGCLSWMKTAGYPEPPRSACIGCPYRSRKEWQWLIANEPDSFVEAVEFDKTMRACRGMRSEVFLHSQRIPLSEVDFRTDYERGQLSLFDMVCPTCMM